MKKLVLSFLAVTALWSGTASAQEPGWSGAVLYTTSHICNGTYDITYNYNDYLEFLSYDDGTVRSYRDIINGQWGACVAEPNHVVLPLGTTSCMESTCQDEEGIFSHIMSNVFKETLGCYGLQCPFGPDMVFTMTVRVVDPEVCQMRFYNAIMHWADETANTATRLMYGPIIINNPNSSITYAYTQLLTTGSCAPQPPWNGGGEEN